MLGIIVPKISIRLFLPFQGDIRDSCTHYVNFLEKPHSQNAQRMYLTGIWYWSSTKRFQMPCSFRKNRGAVRIWSSCRPCSCQIPIQSKHQFWHLNGLAPCIMSDKEMMTRLRFMYFSTMDMADRIWGYWWADLNLGCDQTITQCRRSFSRISTV